jgi:hypothetical protein
MRLQDAITIHSMTLSDTQLYEGGIKHHAGALMDLTS